MFVASCHFRSRESKLFKCNINTITLINKPTIARASRIRLNKSIEDRIYTILEANIAYAISFEWCGIYVSACDYESGSEESNPSKGNPS